MPKVLDPIARLLQPSDFYLPRHRQIFSVMLTLREQGLPVDPITVTNLVADGDDLGRQETRDYIWSLPQAAVPASHAPHHARIVKNLAARRHVRAIARELLSGSLEAGEAQERLLALSSNEATDEMPTTTAVEFCQLVPAEPVWIVEGYLAQGAITELDAKIKTGKTHFTLDLIRAVLAGERFLDRPTLLSPVLYLTEERPTTFRAALKRVGLDRTDGLYLTFRKDVSLSWRDIGHAVAAKAGYHGIKLVVVDTLSDWSGLEADMENDAGAALAAMRPLQAMAGAGLAVLVLRHERKSGGGVGDSARGSSAFGGAADMLLSLRKDPAGGQENRRILEAVGRLDSWVPRLVLEMTDGHYRSLGTSTHVEAERARAFLLDLLPTDPSVALTENDALAQAEGRLSRSTVKRMLDELVEQNQVRRAKAAGSASTRAYGYWKEDR